MKNPVYKSTGTPASTSGTGPDYGNFDGRAQALKEEPAFLRGRGGRAPPQSPHLHIATDHASHIPSTTLKNLAAFLLPSLQPATKDNSFRGLEYPCNYTSIPFPLFFPSKTGNSRSGSPPAKNGCLLCGLSPLFY